MIDGNIHCCYYEVISRLNLLRQSLYMVFTSLGSNISQVFNFFVGTPSSSVLIHGDAFWGGVGVEGQGVNFNFLFSSNKELYLPNSLAQTIVRTVEICHSV